MSPTLDEIQVAINRCSRAILGTAKHLTVWSSPQLRAAGATIFDEIAKDKEIVKMVLLLTGSFEGAKRQVYEYLETFLQYEWLWKDNKSAAYETFLKKKPSLEDCAPPTPRLRIYSHLSSVFLGPPDGPPPGGA